MERDAGAHFSGCILAATFAFDLTPVNSPVGSGKDALEIKLADQGGVVGRFLPAARFSVDGDGAQAFGGLR